jgi:hypothetical protein
VSAPEAGKVDENAPEEVKQNYQEKRNGITIQRQKRVINSGTWAPEETTIVTKMKKNVNQYAMLINTR